MDGQSERNHKAASRWRAEPRPSRTVQYVGGKDKAVHGFTDHRDETKVLAWLKWCDVAGFRPVLGVMICTFFVGCISIQTVGWFVSHQLSERHESIFPARSKLRTVCNKYKNPTAARPELLIHPTYHKIQGGK